MSEIQELQKPDWLLPRNIVNERRFCDAFYKQHYLIYQDGAFYSPEGRLAEEQVKTMIFQELQEHIQCGLSTKVENCLGALRYIAAQNTLKDSLEEKIFTIHAANGEYYLDRDEFVPIKHLTRYRLPVNYNPQAPKPEKWLAFLSQLLHEEDIPPCRNLWVTVWYPTPLVRRCC